jgi:hypothetical protein
MIFWSDANPVGADLSAKAPVHPLDFYRQRHRIRGQVRSHGLIMVLETGIASYPNFQGQRIRP